MASNEKVKKKKYTSVATGRCYVNTSFNNIFITFTNSRGDVLVSVSAGQCGYGSSKKSTPFVGKVAAEKACDLVQERYGLKMVSLYVSGPGAGREPAMMAICTKGIRIAKIIDRTPIPHNGCRPRKRRKV